MDIGRAIAGILGELGKEERKVRVGRISPELEEEFSANRNAAELAKNEIEDKINAFVKTLEVEHSLKQFADRKIELWEKVYDELGLTQEERGLRYKIDHETRVITRVDEVVAEEMEFKL